MKKFTILFIFFLSCLSAFAQSNSKIIGSVKEEKTKQSVSYATVVLYQWSDSTLVSGSMSTETGSFCLDNIPQGKYYLSASCMGYETLSKPIEFPDPESKEIVLLLKKSTVALEEVVVEAHRKPVQFQKDKMIVNVASYAPTAGKTASDLLKILPGVLGDGSDLTVLGKTAIVYIDGRPSNLTGSELSKYLNSLHAGQIDKVEIITNPSSKYDAGQDGAILDIRLKRDATLGVNGYASLMLGIRGSRLATTPAVSLNYRTKKLNLYGSYNLDNGRYKHTYDATSRYADLPIPVQYDEHTIYKPKGTSNYGRLGLDYFGLSRQTLGLVVSGGNYNGGNTNRTITSIHTIGSQTIDSTVVSPIDMDINSKYMSANLNHVWKINDKGSNLNTDVNYFLMDRKEGQTILSDYYHNQTLYRPQTGKGHSTTYKSNLFNLRTDYTLPFRENGLMETGVKYDYVDRNNDIRSQQWENEKWINDAGATNHMNYKEQILAAYVQASEKFRKISVNAGIRYEVTFQEGKQTTTGESFSHSYSNLFPSLGIAYQIKDHSDISLSYTKKIKRPSLGSLNPFKFYTSPYIYQVGNPDLDPSVFHSVDLKYQIRSYSFTFSYNRRNNVIIQEPFQNDETKEISYTYKNFGRTDVYGLYIYLPFTLTKWWECSFDLSGNYQDLKSLYMGTLYRHDFFSGNISTSHTFKVAKDFTIHLNAGYHSDRWYIASKDKNWGSMDISLMKSFWDGQGNISLTLTDPFRWDISKSILIYQNLYHISKAVPDLRAIRISFQYRFGSSKIQKSRSRNTGIEELRSRAY